MISRRPVAPDLPLKRKNSKHHRPPVVAEEARPGILVLAEKFGKIEIVDKLVVENYILVVPEHLIVECVGVKRKTDDCKNHNYFCFGVKEIHVIFMLCLSIAFHELRITSQK